MVLVTGDITPRENCICDVSVYVECLNMHALLIDKGLKRSRGLLNSNLCGPTGDITTS